jgi:hypothetical protein
MYLLNHSPLQTLDAFAPPTEADLPALACKNAPLEKVAGDLTPYVLRVIARMNALIDDSPSASKRYRHLDVKVHDLTEGQQTANGFWHLDSSLHPVAEYDNLLFVTGQHALTEFVTNPLQLEHQANAGAFHLAIASQPTLCVERVPSCTIVRYNGSNVHRGPRAKGAERRLLIRMVTTDVLLPRRIQRPQLARR